MRNSGSVFASRIQTYAADAQRQAANGEIRAAINSIEELVGYSNATPELVATKADAERAVNAGVGVNEAIKALASAAQTAGANSMARAMLLD